MIGTTIANYRIEEQIGEGGMGVVYRATDLNLDRVVAIKVLSADLSRDPGLLERFRAEAKAQAHLNHTNIASLFSLLNVDGQTSIVMEYLEGETFDQMLRRRGLIPSEEAVPLFRQALLGIGFAHRMGIVHRDIKPSNIMVNKYGVVKVMDFGIAKVLGGQRLTRTGTQVGTVAYMSPEQIRNKPVDIRSDIYSLGVTLYEMLTAHLPFESESEFEVMSDHVNTPPPPPTRHYPYIPRGVEQCVLKALVKDPNGRFQTVEEFGAALEHTEGIEQWLEEHPRPVAPAVVHTGGTPPPASIAPGGPALASTPPPLSTTPAPAGGKTVVQTVPPPAAAAAATPGGGLWSKKNRPFVAGGAALLILACAIGGYELMKPNPKPIHIAGGGGGGGGSIVPGGPSNTHQPSTPAVNTTTAPAQATDTSPISIGDTASHSTPSAPTSPSAPAAGKEVSAQAMQNAQRALNSGHLFRPRNNSAVYWAKLAAQSGNPDAARLEQAILQTGLRQVERYRQAKNFSAASTLVTQMMESYPESADLRQLSATIQTEQTAYEQEKVARNQPPPAQPQQPVQQIQTPVPQQQTVPQPRPQQPQPQYQAPTQPQPRAQGVSFRVEHRHIGFNSFNDRFDKSFCAGILSISPNGTVRYDCQQTQDQRCDHISFSADDIKQVKLTRGGGLHIGTRRAGNWDFFGQSQQIEGAFQALDQLVKKH